MALSFGYGRMPRKKTYPFKTWLPPLRAALRMSKIYRKGTYHFEATPTARGVRLESASGVHDDLVIALALAEFAIAPLREVPPASRGEPRSATVRFPLRAGGT